MLVSLNPLWSARRVIRPLLMLAIACAMPTTHAQSAAPAAAASAPVAAASAAAPLAPLSDCVAVLRREVVAHNGPGQPAEALRVDTFDRLTRDVQDLRPTIDSATQAQPEFVLPVWDYITRRVDDERIQDGRAVLAEQASALPGIEARHGVDGATVVAVFGIETDFGRVALRYPVIDATLSRACLRPDSTDRRRQLFSALWLVQEGYVDPADFRGSWAGAFGMTQFMPATFRANMDQADGSGKPDIVHSVPDALGSTARFLKTLKWTAGVPWGVEVRADKALVERANAPEADHGCTVAAQGGGKCRGWAEWLAAGVTPLAGASAVQARWPGLTPQTRAALFAPGGAEGPVWLVTGNYHALWQYNRADAYALAIGLLSDHLRGDPPMHTPWPTDDPGLSRADVRELQRLLRARGACDVTPDGRDGPRTLAAVRAFEADQGWTPTGRAGKRVLDRLRALPADGAGAAPESVPAAGCP